MKRLLSLVVAVAMTAVSAFAVVDGSQLIPQQQLNGRYGYVSPTGRLLIPARFDSAQPFRENLAAVEVGGKWGYIDAEGRFVVKPQFRMAYDFNGGYGIVQDRKTRFWGAVNAEGELVVPCTYESPSDLSDIKVVVNK